LSISYENIALEEQTFGFICFTDPACRITPGVAETFVGEPAKKENHVNKLEKYRNNDKSIKWSVFLKQYNVV